MTVLQRARILILNVLAEYVLSTLDKIANWARQGSMWPMTFGERSSRSIYAVKLCFYLRLLGEFMDMRC